MFLALFFSSAQDGLQTLGFWCFRVDVECASERGQCTGGWGLVVFSGCLAGFTGFTGFTGVWFSGVFWLFGGYRVWFWMLVIFEQEQSHGELHWGVKNGWRTQSSTFKENARPSVKLPWHFESQVYSFSDFPAMKTESAQTRFAAKTGPSWLLVNWNALAVAILQLSQGFSTNLAYFIARFGVHALYQPNAPVVLQAVSFLVGLLEDDRWLGVY